MIDLGNCLLFDLETTGVDVATARIVTSSAIPVVNGTPHDEQWLADPGIPIPVESTNVHGISTEYAQAHGEDHDIVLRRTIDRINLAWDHRLPVLVYNAPYDLTLLSQLDPTFTVRGPVIDPLVLDKVLYPYRKGNRRLTTIAAKYGVPFDGAHDSSADCLGTWNLAKKMLEIMAESAETYQAQDGTVYKFSDAARDPAVMYRLQQAAGVEKQRSLAEYFAHLNRHHDGRFGWPMYTEGLEK